MLRSELGRRMPAPVVRWMRGWEFWGRRRLRGAHFRVREYDALAARWPSGETLALPVGTPACVVAKNEHGSYCVPRSSQHRLVSRTILEARVWESDTIDLVREADPHGDIVCAGTFFGDFIPAFARSRDIGARVWAFEPGRENYACAQVTIMLNELDNVTLQHAALDAKSGTALLATTNRKGVPLGGGSHVVRDLGRTRWSDNEKVELVTLDDAVGKDRRVVAVQLDVEGHEQQVLSGGLGTLARCLPLIVVETLPSAWILH